MDDFLTSFRVSASGLAAQRLRLNLIAENVANANTTRNAAGEKVPYQRRDAIFTAQSFDSVLRDEVSNAGSTGVAVDRIQVDQNPPRMQYDPTSPDANASGYVAMPNIDIVTETVNMMSASRSYESNVAVLNATKAMALKALDIGGNH